MKPVNLGLPLFASLAVLLANPAYAVDPLFVVTSIADTTDGTCDAHCTLREAITAANGVLSSTIQFDAGVFTAHQVINLASALPSITASVIIAGPSAGVTIRRNSVGKYRIFTVPNAGLTVKMYGLTITNGDTNSDGGGIYSKSHLDLGYVIVDGNRSAHNGGGLALWATGSLTFSTFSNNSADWGGGLYFEHGPTDSVVLGNSTVSGNTSSFGTAILLANITHEDEVTLALNSCTIAYNTGNSSGILSYSWGASRQTLLVLTNNILANNGLQNLGQSIGNGGSANFNSGGYNLATDAPGALTGTGDQLNKDPLLAPLALYGGRTPVHALRSGSPALDQGNQPTGSDQRFLQRPFDIAGIANAFNGSDTGAVEMQALNVTNADDSGVGSLRQALLVANADGAGNDDILFDSVFFATPRVLNLASALGPITSSVNLLGPGADRVNLRRDTGGDYRIITNTVAGLYIGIHDMTLSNGNVPSAFGGGILSSSYLDLRRSVVSGNQALSGGGIFLSNSGVIESSTISGNQAQDSGGIFISMSQGQAQATVVQLVNSTVSDNIADSYPGIWVSGTGGDGRIDLNVMNSTIANNTGVISGPGLLLDVNTSGVNATVTLANSMFANNSYSNLLVYPAEPGSSANVVSLGRNLSTDNAQGHLSGPGDLVNTDPLLYPLANYGGPTLTRLMAPGSPAVDAGDCALSGVTRDQRGKQRPFDRPGSANVADGCDIGALEWSDLNGNGAEDGDEVFQNGFE